MSKMIDKPDTACVDSVESEAALPQMLKDLQFLIDLQKELRSQPDDCQAFPRFWAIKDYKMVPGHEDYDSGHYEHYHNDGDHVVFRNFADLKEFLEEYHDDEIDVYDELKELLNDGNESFHDLWEYVEDNLNDDGYFSKVFVKEEDFIVPDTMFLTKEEVKRHLELNHYHYTKKAHTYAMTAWRAPKVERLLKILHGFDFERFRGVAATESTEITPADKGPHLLKGDAE